MDPLPRLVCAPSMSLEAVSLASKARVATPAFAGGVGYCQPEGPHHWVLRVGDEDLDIGPSRLTALEIAEGRVVRIRSTLGLDYVSPAAAAEMGEQLRSRLREGGFSETDALSREIVREELVSSGGARACRLRAGEWLGEIRAQRLIEAKSAAGQILSLAEDACLVVCTLWDIRGAAALIG